MKAVQFLLEYFGLFEQYPYLCWSVPFTEMLVWQGMTKLMVWALIYRFFRWFLLTGWLVKLLEILVGHLWLFILTIISRMITGIWQFLTKVVGLLMQEMLKYRVTKILLIGASIYGSIRLWYAIHSLLHHQ
jgi:hypothetical protein